MADIKNLKLNLNIVDYNFRLVENAQIELEELERLESIVEETKVAYSAPFERTYDELKDQLLPDGKYRIRVSAAGLETQERIITIHNRKVKERFVLGEEGMKYYHVNNMRMPVAEDNNTLVIRLINGVSEEEERKLMASLEKRFKIETSQLDEDQEDQGFRLLHLPEKFTAKKRETLLKKLYKDKKIADHGIVLHRNEEEGGIEFVNNEILVGFQPGAPIAAVSQLLEEIDAEIVSTSFNENNLYLLRFPLDIGYNILDFCNKLDDHELVAFAHPNSGGNCQYYQVNPTDYLVPEQWHLNLVNLPQAWNALEAGNDPGVSQGDPNDISFGSAKIAICVIDSGLHSITIGGNTFSKHPDLAGTVTDGQTKMIGWYDFNNMVANNDNPRSGHGMGCAGASSANGNNVPNNGAVTYGLTGAAPNTRTIGVMNGSTAVAYENAFRWSAGFRLLLPATTPLPPAQSADIISNSWGNSSAAIQAACIRAFNFLTTFGRGGRGTLILFAAGNAQAPAAVTLVNPLAADPRTLCIGASSLMNDGITERFSDFTCFGDEVDVVAPSHDQYAVGNFRQTTHQPPANYGALSMSEHRGGNINNSSISFSRLSVTSVAASPTVTMRSVYTFQNGQTVIFTRPGNPGHRARTIAAGGVNVATRQLTFTANMGAPNLASGFTVMPLSRPTTLAANALAGATQLSLVSTVGYAPGHEVLIGTPGTAASEIHRIVSVNSLTNTIIINAGLAGPHNAIPAPAAPVNIVDELKRIDKANMPGGVGQMSTTLQQGTAAGTLQIQVNDANGFVNGQQILFRNPGDPNHRVRTIATVDSAQFITLQTAVGAAFGAGTVIQGITNLTFVPTLTLNANPPGGGVPNSVLRVSTTVGFVMGQNVLIGTPGTAGSEIRQINNVNPATNEITVVPAIANAHTVAPVTTIHVVGGAIQTTLAAASLAGTNNITVASTAGFQVGQAVIIGTVGGGTGNPAIADPQRCDKLVIAHIPNGNTLVLATFKGAATVYPHAMGVAVVGGAANFRTTMGGTSFATPLVAGITGLVLSANPHLTWIEVRSILRSTANQLDLTFPGLPYAGNAGLGRLAIVVNAAAGRNANVGIWEDINGVDTRLPGGAGPNGAAGAPVHNEFYGYGRINAQAAVQAAFNYDHDQRDLMIRNHLQDDGKVETDVATLQIKSPDIWIRNTAPGADADPSYGSPTDPFTPGGFNQDGPHQKPVRDGNRWIYARVSNRGNTLRSLDAWVRFYVAVTSGDEDFIYPQQWAEALPIGNITNTSHLYFIGSVPIFGTAAGATVAAVQPPGIPALPLTPGTNNHRFIGPGAFYTAQMQWNRANIPTLPFPHPAVRLVQPTVAGDMTINVSNTHGFFAGQVVLFGVPGSANHRQRTVQSKTDFTLTFTASVGAAFAVPVPPAAPQEIIGLSATQVNIATAAVAAATTIEVATSYGFINDRYILIGAAGSANSELCRIVSISRPAAGNHVLTITPALSNGHGAGQPITQLQGKVEIYLLAEVSPHDGLLAGDRPANNNNISYRKISLVPEVLFLDSTGASPLPKKIQVNTNGNNVNVPFRLQVRDSENFNVEDVFIEVIRQQANPANNEVVTFKYYPAAGGNPAAWKLDDAVQTWLVLNAPVDEAAVAVLTGANDDVRFNGDFDITNAHTGIQINVTVKGTYSPSGAAVPFSHTETCDITVFTVANLPGGGAAAIQNGTGTQVLAGTQRMHVFADMANLEQTQAQAYGIVNSERFRLTSNFTTASNPGVNVRAFAVLDSLVFMQRNLTDNTINLVLRPIRQAQIGFTRVKYFIYRGLQEADFVSAGNPLEARASTGSPVGDFLDSLHAVQAIRAPGVNLPLTALGWDPANQPANDLLDHYFYNSNPAVQLPVVKKGMTLGKFNNPTAADEFGFEIILAENYYPLSLSNIRAKEFILDVSAITNADEKRWKREDILNYVDPAAYFGMHFYTNVEIPDPANVDPNVIQTLRRSGTNIYTDIVSKFYTKNTLYMDIRNESGYSYNYYDNYTVNTAGVNNGTSLKTGVIPPATTALTSRKYNTQNWPIIIQDNSLSPALSDNNFNNIYVQLRRADNGDPIIYLEYGFAITGTTAGSNYFIRGTELQNQSVVDAINPATNLITVRNNLVGTVNVGDVIHLIGCDHRSANKAYIATAVAANGGNPAFTDITVQAGTIDPAANAGALGSIGYGDWLLPTGFSYPNQAVAASPNQKLDVSYVIKMRYCRHINPMVSDIVGINQASKTITIRGDYTAQLNGGQSILVRKAALGAANNNQSFTIAINGVSLSGANTTLTVLENIPAAFAGGPTDGEVVMNPNRVVNTHRYTDNVFGPLSSLVKSVTINAIVVIGPASATLTISGNHTSDVLVGNSISIINSANNNGRYTVTASVLNAGNTDITIATPAALNAAVDGKVSFLYSLWNSDKPTKWLTGFDKRFLDMTNDPLDNPTTPLRDFSYLGQTGVAIEPDRAIFFLSPIDFFKQPANNDIAVEIVNMNGGTSDQDTFWGAMQAQNQRLKLNATMLRLNPGGGEILVPIFDFEDDPADAVSDIKKENFLALCLTKAEFVELIDAAQTTFKEYHDIYFNLRNEQMLTDLNGINYRQYEVVISGHAYNANGDLISIEAKPANPVQVLAQADDRVVFSSEDFANLEIISDATEDYEEGFRTNQEALNILGANIPLQNIVNNFDTDLNAIVNDLVAIKNLIETRAELLWTTAIAQADTAGASPFDDRPLYWARLHMRVSIRRHAFLKTQRRAIREMIEILEQHSRGLQTVDFSGSGSATHKVLLLGFDPFEFSSNIKQSNPAGASALHLHGKTASNATNSKSAYIQTAVFPVRYGDFNNGIVERFIQPFLDGTTPVDMIITGSQDIDVFFNIDRFASKYRDPTLTDNLNRLGGKAKFYTIRNNKVKRAGTIFLPQFYETTLPFADMIAPGGRLDNNRVVYNQEYTTSNPADFAPSSGQGSGIVQIAGPQPGHRARGGSGGVFLSNEIFYRIAHIRTKLSAATRTGHLHMPKLQQNPGDDFSVVDTTTLVNDTATIIGDALDNI